MCFGFPFSVLDQSPKLTLHKDPAFDTMYVGELVNFTCSINMPADMEYTWFRDGIISSSESGNTVSVLLAVGSGGKYSCKATRGNIEVTSEKILQVVIGE